jgi:hypothetical protein
MPFRPSAWGSPPTTRQPNQGWYTLTLAATGITGFSLLLLLVPATWLAMLPEIGAEGTFLAVLLALALSVMYLLVLAALARKRFGTLLRFQD